MPVRQTYRRRGGAGIIAPMTAANSIGLKGTGLPYGAPFSSATTRSANYVEQKAHTFAHGNGSLD